MHTAKALTVGVQDLLQQWQVTLDQRATLAEEHLHVRPRAYTMVSRLPQCAVHCKSLLLMT
jgi:hypothetical protein